VDHGEIPDELLPELLLVGIESLDLVLLTEADERVKKHYFDVLEA
jgi:hypothetical protein